MPLQVVCALCLLCGSFERFHHVINEALMIKLMLKNYNTISWVQFSVNQFIFVKC